jgi:hemolysin activation/secretion protein
MRHFAITATTLLVAVANIAVAETNSSSILQQQQQLGMPQALQLLPDLSPEPMTALPEAVGDSVTVTAIRFTGQQNQVSLFELDNLVAEAKGQDLDFAGLQTLRDRVTDYFKAQGWILTRAYLPKQDVTEGVITIAIVPGIVSPSNPVVVNKLSEEFARQQTQLIEDMATARVAPGKPLKESQLSTSMLLINDLPGVTATSRLQAGQEQGSTEVVIDLEESKVITGMTWLDNYGSQSTGEYQGNLNLQWNNPTGSGDQTTLLVMANEGSNTTQLSYSGPQGINGDRLQASFSNMDYKVISGAGLASNVKGYANTVKFNWRSPQQRSQLTNRYVTVDLEHLQSKDWAQGQLLTQKEKNTARLTYAGSHIDSQGGGMNTWSFGATNGNLSLPVDTNNDQYGVKGSYNKLTYNLTRLQKLANNLNLFASINGQITGQNLDGSEKIALGGPSAVRAYPGGEGSGDKGFVSSLELRYDMPTATSLGHLQAQAFYDYGRTQLHYDMMGIPLTTATQENQYSIKGYGLGITLSKQGSYQVKAIWAQKHGDNPGRDSNGNDADGFNNKQRFWVQANFWF